MPVTCVTRRASLVKFITCKFMYVDSLLEKKEGNMITVRARKILKTSLKLEIWKKKICIFKKGKKAKERGSITMVRTRPLLKSNTYASISSVWVAERSVNKESPSLKS